MMTKLLLTALAIVGALMLVRTRRQRAIPATAVPLAAAPRLTKSRLPWVAAYALLVMTLGGAGFVLYQQWQDDYRVITLRVIDSATGKETRYEARRGEVEGRRFRTLDGKEVVLAEVERLELGGD